MTRAASAKAGNRDRLSAAGAVRSSVGAVEPSLGVVAPHPLAAQVCAALSASGVGEPMLRRLRTEWSDWAELAAWMPLRSSWGDDDVAALCTLPGLGAELTDIEGWIRLGPLQAGVRLTLKNISPDMVRRFPLDAEHGSDAFVQMMQATVGTGIHLDDLLWWHTAGVLSLNRPYLNQPLWAQWRAVGATRIGLRRAALAGAAGLSPTAAVDAVAEGRDDEAAWRMMAGLRVGQRV